MLSVITEGLPQVPVLVVYTFWSDKARLRSPMTDTDTSSRSKRGFAFALGILTTAYSGLTAFTRLQALSMDLRLWIVGLGVVLFVLGIVWIIAPRPKMKTGFGVTPDKSPSRLRIIFSFIWKLVAIAVLCGLAILVMRETVTFHSIRMIRESDLQNESAGTVRFLASQFSTTLVVDAAVLQRGGLKFIAFDLKPCSQEHVELETVIGDENEFERKVQVQAFRRPQCFRFSFSLSGPATSLIVNPAAKPDDVSIVAQEHFNHWKTFFNYLGGVLCLVAFVLLCCLF